MRYIKRSIVVSFFIICSSQQAKIDSSEIVLPQPFPVIIPQSCHLQNYPQLNGLYNKGYCPRTPCHTLFGFCSRSHECCLSNWHTKTVPVVCFEKLLQTNITIVLSCRCQKCDKIHRTVNGYVYSSLNHKPLSLAAVVLNQEIMAFTNREGRFVFEISTPYISTMLIQEPNHKSLEVSIPSVEADNIVVTMEHISFLNEVTSFINSIVLRLEPPNQSNMIGYLYLPGQALSAKRLMDVHYTGPGRILYSLSSGGMLHFTTAALNRPVYTDTQGTEFIIFSCMSGTFGLFDEDGEALYLRRGISGQLNFLLPLPLSIEAKEKMEKLHFFHFNGEKDRWVDLGRMQITTRKSKSKYQESISSIRLNHLPPLWTIAQPIRASCYVRIFVNTLPNRQQFTNPMSIKIHLRQNSSNAGKIVFTYYQQLASFAGQAQCLAVVCSLGGKIVISSQYGHLYIPLSPDIQYGLVFGSIGQLIFYCNSNADVNSSPASPYYPTLHDCANVLSQSTLKQFVFNPPSVLLNPTSGVLPTTSRLSSSLPSHHDTAYHEKCYVKVGVLTCNLETNIAVRAIPKGSAGAAERIILSSETIYHPAGQNKCLGDSVRLLCPLAICIKYPCNHHLVLSAGCQMNQSMSSCCVPWTFSPTLANFTDSHPHSVTIQDHSKLHNSDSGLYSAVTDALAYMRCISGRVHRPSLSLDSSVGVAVTFSCRAS